MRITLWADNCCCDASHNHVATSVGAAAADPLAAKDITVAVVGVPVLIVAFTRKWSATQQGNDDHARRIKTTYIVSGLTASTDS